MKLNDIITINRIGLETVTDTVQGHLLDFVSSCATDLRDMWVEQGEYSLELENALSYSLELLVDGFDIDEKSWGILVHGVWDDREWAIVD